MVLISSLQIVWKSTASSAASQSLFAVDLRREGEARGGRMACRLENGEPLGEYGPNAHKVEVEEKRGQDLLQVLHGWNAEQVTGMP